MTRLGNDIVLGEKEWHIPLLNIKIGLGKLETFLTTSNKGTSF